MKASTLGTKIVILFLWK